MESAAFRLLTHRRVVRPNQADQLVPRHHVLHVRQKLGAARHLAVLLKSRQRALVHCSLTAMNQLSFIFGGKSDLP
jgi:hypothetical protein